MHGFPGTRGLFSSFFYRREKTVAEVKEKKKKVLSLKFDGEIEKEKPLGPG